MGRAFVFGLFHLLLVLVAMFIGRGPFTYAHLDPGTLSGFVALLFAVLAALPFVVVDVLLESALEERAALFWPAVAANSICYGIAFSLWRRHSGWPKLIRKWFGLSEYSYAALGRCERCGGEVADAPGAQCPECDEPIVYEPAACAKPGDDLE